MYEEAEHESDHGNHAVERTKDCLATFLAI
jgi:hypothetical protein